MSETGWSVIRKTRLEARASLWTGIGCFLLSAVIIFVFAMMVIEQLPGPGP